MAITNERRDHLLLVVDHLIETWNKWSSNPDTRYITKTFEDAVEECLFVFADGTIPGDLRTLHERMDVLQEHWQAWNQRNETSGGKYPIPGEEFWKAMKAMETARIAATRPVRRSLEPIAQLDALRPQPTDAQICRMYGFMDDDGAPEIWKLQEERAEPGKHTGPDTGWMPPYERRQQAEEAQRQEIIERLTRQRDSKVKFLTAVAKESIEELVGTGVGGKQICNMKKIEREELEAYCDEHRLAIPEWESLSLNAVAADTDYEPEEEPAEALRLQPMKPPARMAMDDYGESESESEIESEPVSPDAETVTELADGPMTLEQEIVMYHQAGGMDAKAIAAAVSRPGNEVNYQKVGKVIKRWEKDPTAFETLPSVAVA